MWKILYIEINWVFIGKTQKLVVTNNLKIKEEILLFQVILQYVRNVQIEDFKRKKVVARTKKVLSTLFLKSLGCYLSL